MREAPAGSDRPDAPPPGASDPGDMPAGIRDLLARFVASAAGAVETRVQLAALEFAQERERARDRLVLVLVAAIAGALALLALNALVVVAFWDRFGWMSLAALTLLWLAVAAMAAWRLSIGAQREERPFAATLAEFERDRAWLSERFGGRRR